jgi:hypothetical protein
MTALLRSIGTADVILALDGPLDVGSLPAPFLLDSEIILVTGGDLSAQVSVSRGQFGTAPASHSAGTTLVGGTGAGVPAGGTTGQVLTKASNADGDTDWETGGGLPAEWTATAHNLLIPVTQLDASNADSPYAITDSDTGLVVNRASGFVSEWFTFDLGRPGVGFGRATLTAVDLDGEVSGQTIFVYLRFDVSIDGMTWHTVVSLDSPDSTWPKGQTVPSPIETEIGGVFEYVTFTPRCIRFRVVISDGFTVYAGANNPTVSFDFEYTAG